MRLVGRLVLYRMEIQLPPAIAPLKFTPSSTGLQNMGTTSIPVVFVSDVNKVMGYSYETNH